MSLDWTERDLREGLRCFHSAAFFEAHEHWESVWLVAQEPEKTFLQGLIQVAASFHHFQRGNLAGTVSLLRSALRRLDTYPEAFAGVAVAPLRTSICLWLAALETPQSASLPPVPQLQLVSSTSPPGRTNFENSWQRLPTIDEKPNSRLARVLHPSDEKRVHRGKLSTTRPCNEIPHGRQNLCE